MPDVCRNKGKAQLETWIATKLTTATNEVFLQQYVADQLSPS
jgi:hypothetical protein